MPNQRKKIIVIVTLFVLLLVGAFYFYLRSVRSEVTPNANNSNQGNVNTSANDKVIDSDLGTSSNVLLFPQAKLRLTLPNTYHIVTKAEVDNYNDPDGEQQVMNACRLFSIWSEGQFGLNISYDVYTPLCGTERGGSSITEPQFQVEFDKFCESLLGSESYVYGGCTLFRDPPEGFRGYSYYQFVYDYGSEENTGTIMREVFLESINTPSRKIILGYVPVTEDLLRIYADEFQQYVSRIYANEFAGFRSDARDVQTFESIVRSLESM